MAYGNLTLQQEISEKKLIFSLCLYVNAHITDISDYVVKSVYRNVVTLLVWTRPNWKEGFVTTVVSEKIQGIHEKQNVFYIYFYLKWTLVNVSFYIKLLNYYIIRLIDNIKQGSQTWSRHLDRKEGKEKWPLSGDKKAVLLPLGCSTLTGLQWELFLLGHWAEKKTMTT